MKHLGLTGPKDQTYPLTPAWGRIIMVLIGIIGLYLIGRVVADVFVERFGFHLSVVTEPMMHRLIMTAASGYIVLMAIPFMPGVEIGITMIVFFGSSICFLIYICTVFALTLSYLAGRLVPTRYWVTTFRFLGLNRAQNLVQEITPLSADARFALLAQKAPHRIVPFLLRHRFIALAVVINLPGNILIGGGGGIGLIAGATGIFPFWKYLLTVAVAVSPVPLIVSLTES